MIYGLTLDDVDDFNSRKKGVLNAILALPRRATVRIVIDNDRPFTDYKFMVESVSKMAEVMIQVQDSYGEKEQSYRQYREKCIQLMVLYPQVKLWEVGNEVNGDWCGPRVWDKVEFGIDQCKRLNFKSMITYFDDDTLFPFLDKNKAIAADYAGLSCYPTSHRELGTMLKEIRDHKAEVLLERTGSGEFVIAEYGEDEWVNSPTIRRVLVESFEQFNGGFYWNFQKQATPKAKGLWKAIADCWRKRRA